MDGFLDALTPFASLLARTTDPSSAVADLDAALGSGDLGQVDRILQQHFGADRVWAASALNTAAAAAASHTERRIRLAQIEVLALVIQRNRELASSLVMTVPDFLRQAWTEHLREFPAADWPRETWPAMLDIASSAESELLLAAPFFNVEQVHALTAHVARLTSAGGQVLVVTQGTWDSHAGPNAASVNLLNAAARAPGQMKVWSWPGPGLGIHFKALVVDRYHGYLGSANITTHGALHHAEVGVILHGSLAHQLDHWVRKIAAQSVEHHSAP